MSKKMPGRPPKLKGERRFALVASLYNSEYVDGLVEAARAELKALAPKAVVDVVQVPGSYEIPLGVKAVLDNDDTVDAVLAFGLLWEGETSHAGLIATAVTNALMDISLNYDTPVLHEVLVVKTDEQAKERCLGTKINRGTEAARAAVRMCQTLESLPKNPLNEIPF
jgi:6,7-dimethyl-8-ribityllumazine synthase